jgi:hypothetical protein
MGNGSGWRSDARFQAKRFSGAAAPRKISAEGRSGDDALRKACFEESATRQNYRRPVYVGKERTAREE